MSDEVFVESALPGYRIAEGYSNVLNPQDLSVVGFSSFSVPLVANIIFFADLPAECGF